MSAYILSNAKVYLKDVLSSTATVGSTFRISGNLEIIAKLQSQGITDLSSANIETGGVNAFFVLKNGTQIERFLVTATGGVATIVKRGLNQDGLTTDNTIQKTWSDGTFGYITSNPQDFISVNKLDSIGGLRTGMLKSQNIGATNGSTAITVADTTGWDNGATITGTGIPNGTTIVSFVPNTSAVLSAAYTGTTGTVSVQVGIRYVTEIDTSGNEVKKSVSNGSTISSTETIRKRKASGGYEEVAYSVLQADMALAGGGSFSVSPYESSIALGNPVGLSDDGLFLCTTENKSSANITASTVAVNLGQAVLDSTRTVFYYAVGVNTYARVGTLTNDTMTYGTEVNVGNGSSGTMSGAVVLINTDKVVFMYMDGSTGSAATLLVGTISGTTITLNVGTTLASSGNTRQIRSACKIRNDAFIVSVYPNSTNGVGFLQAYTVSGTTITAGTATNAGIDWQYKFGPVIYLSDNRIGTYTQFINGTFTLIPLIYDINPANTSITTTYTGANQGNAEGYIARYSDDTYIMTMTAVNTNTLLVPKPGAGTTITLSNLFDNGASKFLPCITGGNNRFILIDGTTWYLYQEKTLIGSLTMSLTGPSYGAWVNHQFLSLYQGRIRFISGTNGTARIISFAIVMYFGVANNSTGGVLVRGSITKTGVIQGLLYYVQSDGSIGTGKTAKYIGRGIATDTLLVW